MRFNRGGHGEHGRTAEVAFGISMLRFSVSSVLSVVNPRLCCLL
jgi:hypothetical protein